MAVREMPERVQRSYSTGRIMDHQREDGWMRSFRHAVARVLKSEDGPTAAEYAIMAVSIVVVCIVAIAAVGVNTNQMLDTASKKM